MQSCKLKKIDNCFVIMHETCGENFPYNNILHALDFSRLFINCFELQTKYVSNDVWKGIFYYRKKLRPGLVTERYQIKQPCGCKIVLILISNFTTFKHVLDEVIDYSFHDTQFFQRVILNHFCYILLANKLYCTTNNQFLQSNLTKYFSK